MNESLLLIGIGVAAGLLSGVLGLGGGIIIIPALVLGLGYSQQLAQGTTLLMMVLPVGALAAFQYYKNGQADIRSALIIGVAFFISAFFGAKIAGAIPQDIMKKVFALILIILAIKMLFFEKAIK